MRTLRKMAATIPLITGDLRWLASIFLPSPFDRAEVERRFGIGFFSAVATELGSGQTFLRFFRPRGL